MSEFTVTVVGTGVIGTSIGLALKRGQNPPRLIAHDKDLAVAKEAVKKGAFDKAEWNLINACEPASMVVLAIPLNGIRPTLEAIGPYLQENAVVTDVCRSKVPVLAAVQAVLPAHIHFVGGDPIVNPAGSGSENGEAGLFQNRLYCLTPTASAHEESVQLLVDFVALLGGQPFFLDADEHDGLVAVTEYLPNLMSVALLNALSRQTSWREARKLAGHLFEQVSAGATGDPDGIKDGLLSNRDSIVAWLDQYMAELAQLRTILAETGVTAETGLAKEASAAEKLAQTLDQAIVQRHNWKRDFEQHRFVDPELTPPEIDTPGLLQRWIGFGR